MIDPNGMWPKWVESIGHAIAGAYSAIDDVFHDLTAPGPTSVSARDPNRIAMRDREVGNSPAQADRIADPGQSAREGLSEGPAVLGSEFTKEGVTQVALGGFLKLGGKAVEFIGGRVSESEFLNTALKYLGEGYKEISPGRFVSKDGLRQVRLGAHEMRSRVFHGHFEAFDKAGGKVVENTMVIIDKDPV
jgi:hypothetical protein